MAAYPTTVIFRVARTIERALGDIRAGRPASNDGVNFAEFKDITNYEEWARIEDAYAHGPGSIMKRIGAFALLLTCLTLATDVRAQTKVRLAVGGKPAMFYLPLTVVERLVTSRKPASMWRFRISPAARGPCSR